ncbi:putative peptidase M41 [Helianthus annuus]|uniref:Peptidase M41 n=1 Tax=Helianthus annuus TaxID=4232 RepID=A0A251T519_HELAN|nr:uncharacterized protein LOC110895728 isoform X1 [Helianthus annuus]KAF5779299.1 putative peptidase M41 [Helianthus annuus]KAJ0864031.1 putative peptidase M41 [Helianthus annuus]KAJ0867955.1 putative peptidase M41 [Helianthus annuus]
MNLSVGGGRVEEALRMVDRQLSKGNFKLSLSLLRHPSPPALFRFAAAKQVPRRVSSVEQLHLSVTETSTLHSLLDAILHSIQLSNLFTSGQDNDDIVQHKQVVQHEAGHFLVGYLLGVLPKHYTFSTMEDKTADAHVKFLGFEFLKELEDVALSNKNSHEIKAGHRARKRKLSSTVLSKFACVIVGGLVAEHLAFGNSKGHYGDVEKLNRVLKWQRLTEDEANNLTRWAVLNTLTILHRHTKARSKLAEALLHGRSIGNCIHVIEANLNHPI